MYDRLSYAAKAVIHLSKDEAAALGENSVGTEHILLALVRQNNQAVRLLRMAGIEPNSIREAIFRQVERAHGKLGEEMLLSPRAKMVLDLAKAEADLRRDAAVTTLDLLAGLIRECDGLSARVLLKMGFTLEMVHEYTPNEQETITPK